MSDKFLDTLIKRRDVLKKELDLLNNLIELHSSDIKGDKQEHNKISSTLLSKNIKDIEVPKALSNRQRTIFLALKNLGGKGTKSEVTNEIINKGIEHDKKAASNLARNHLSIMVRKNIIKKELNEAGNNVYII